MAIIGQGISHRGLVQENFETPFFISGTVTQDDIGKPVAIDATANHTVKLADDDDVIIGGLTSFEDRVIEGVQVATVGMKGGFQFVGTAGHTISVGDSLVSAGSGTVKAAATANLALNIVTSVDGDNIQVLLK